MDKYIFVSLAYSCTAIGILALILLLFWHAKRSRSLEFDLIKKINQHRFKKNPSDDRST